MSQLQALRKTIEDIILNPKYADLLAIVKGARNGAVYGARVRFPHALVYAFSLQVFFNPPQTSPTC
jgi:peroxisomal membrane protein 4